MPFGLPLLDGLVTRLGDRGRKVVSYGTPLDEMVTIVPSKSPDEYVVRISEILVRHHIHTQLVGNVTGMGKPRGYDSHTRGGAGVDRMLTYPRPCCGSLIVRAR